MALYPSECVKGTRVYNTLTEEYGYIFIFDPEDDQVLVDYENGSTRWDSIHLLIKDRSIVKNTICPKSKNICPFCGEEAYVGFLNAECKTKDCPNYKD